jgi:hypothetical protein
VIGSFTFENLPCRVVVGSGTLSAAKAEVERFGGKRVLVLTTPRQETEGKKLGASLGSLYAGIFLGAAKLLEKLFGPWSQHQALSPAYQELIAEQRPQARERRTHGGLTNAELLGRPRDVPLDEQNSQRRQEIEVDGSEVYGVHD